MRPVGVLLALAWILPVAAQTYRISGTVVNSVTGAALDRVRLSLAPTSERTRAVYTSTGSDGRFNFANLPAGKWDLTAERRGYRRQSFGQPPSLASASIAVVTGPGEDSAHLVFKLHPPAFITGKVVDSSGDPVQNALVQVLRWGVVGGRRRAVPTSVEWTTDDGRYAIGMLAAGTYFVAVTAQPWYRNSLTPDHPAPAFPTYYYPNTTDPRAAAPIDFRPAREAVVDFTLAPAPAVKLTLKTSGSQPFPLMLVSEGPHESPILISPIQQNAGDARAFLLAPGRYAAWFSQDTSGSPQTQTIDLGYQDTEIELAPREPANVEITVSLSAMKPADVLTLGLALTSEDGPSGMPRMIQREGVLKYPATPPGRFRLGLIGTSAREAYLESVSAEGARFAKGMLELNAGATAKLRVTVRGDGGRVEGKVYRAGRPFAGALVMLAPPRDTGNPSDYQAFVTDSDGSFEYECVRPGQHVIFAVEDGSELEYSDPAVLAPYLKTGRPVTVESNSTLNLRLDLPVPAPK